MATEKKPEWRVVRCGPDWVRADVYYKIQKRIIFGIYWTYSWGYDKDSVIRLAKELYETPEVVWTSV